MTPNLALVPKTENTGDSIPIGQPSDIEGIVVGIGAADAGHPIFAVVRSMLQTANKPKPYETPELKPKGPREIELFLDAYHKGGRECSGLYDAFNK